jgi:hypothetical protein
MRTYCVLRIITAACNPLDRLLPTVDLQLRGDFARLEYMLNVSSH